MVESLDATIGTLTVPLGSVRVSVHVDDYGTSVRLAVLSRNARSCIILDLDASSLAALEELLRRARAVIADRRLAGWGQ